MPPRRKPVKFFSSPGPELFGFEGSTVDRRLANWGSHFELRDTVCAWSDLLAFAKPFVASDWKPSREEWRSIAARLQRAYALHLTYPSLPHNFMLLLNDGVVRTLTDRTGTHFCWEVGMWIRDLVWAHIDVTADERSRGLPGTRTIVTGGQRANYSLEQVTLDDFVALSSQEKRGPSVAATAAGNPTIASNPGVLQMNTAFSKAYILDDLGSDVGIDGSGLFIDESFFALMRASSQATPDRFEFVDRSNDDGLFRAVKFLPGPEDHPWTMAFLLAPEPIHVKEDVLKTTVHRVLKFFPYDENPHTYHVDVPWYPKPVEPRRLGV